ncbi:MAG TPA: DinB family protein [Bryobacteraceae bacterium]|nr:DinB family protein [Bryobacteraceae bacterium]
MKFVIASLLLAGTLAAQGGSKSPLIGTSQAFYAQAKNNILRSADKIPESLWSFRPTPEVRTIGELFAHVADGQYEFCGMASEGKPVDKGVEKTAKTKAAIVSALKDAFAYCDAAYAKMTDATAVETVGFFGRQATRIGAMDYNVVHTYEHYGNLVTYMRIKGIVPPSSEPRR